MNPKHLRVRMDRHTGELWLTEERFRKPVRKVVDLTAEILLAMCADLVAEDGTSRVTRDVKFNPGDANPFTARITVEIAHEDEGSEGAGEVDHS